MNVDLVKLLEECMVAVKWGLKKSSWWKGVKPDLLLRIEEAIAREKSATQSSSQPVPGKVIPARGSVWRYVGPPLLCDAYTATITGRQETISFYLENERNHRTSHSDTAPLDTFLARYELVTEAPGPKGVERDQLGREATATKEKKAGGE